MKQYKDNDDALLQSFFQEHAEPIADNGFTERVVAALPQRRTAAMRLRRWSVGLNLAALVGSIILLITLGAFSTLRTAVVSAIWSAITGLLSFDWDALLVQAMLFLHNLPDLLPNSTQLVGIMLSLMILTGLSVKKLASSV